MSKNSSAIVAIHYVLKGPIAAAFLVSSNRSAYSKKLAYRFSIQFANLLHHPQVPHCLTLTIPSSHIHRSPPRSPSYDSCTTVGIKIFESLYPPNCHHRTRLQPS